MGYLYLLPAAGIFVLLLAAMKETVSKEEQKSRILIPFIKIIRLMCRMNFFADKIEKQIKETEGNLKAVYPMSNAADAAREKCVGLIAKVLMILFFGSILSFISYLALQNNKAISELSRNEAGKGDAVYEVEAEIDGAKLRMPVSVSEKTYSSRERNQWFQYAKDHIGELILGENASLDDVSMDLKLIDTLPGSAIKIDWECSDYTLIQPSGELNNDKLSEEGSNVKLTAIFTYNNYEERYSFEITIRKKIKEGAEGNFDLLKEEIQRSEKLDTESEVYILPTEVDGKKVYYQIEETDTGAVFMILTLIIALFVPLEEKSLMEKERKKRDTQMLIDYPELVCTLSLFMGAGMSISRAWERIAMSYIDKVSKKTERKSSCNEEVVYTYRQLQSGVSKSRAFEEFGNRCALGPYKKLGMLINSNIRKGTADLSDLLQIEATEAMAERKSAALRLSEEASEKLILPMVLELMVIMGVMIVPAFMSING